MNDYTGIADLYDSCVTGTRDHAFWSGLAAEAVGPILELTAGTGRVTVALSRACSERVVALDLAPAMLQRLVARVRESSQRVCAVAGDLTRLPFSSKHFGLVAVPFNSLGELVEESARAAALGELRRVLAPMGRAAVTLHDPEQRRLTLDGEVRRLGPFATAGRRLEVLVRGRLIGPDVAESEQTYRILDADRVLEERQLTLRFALPDVESLVGMAAKAGLEPQAVFGDYDESPYVRGKSPFIIALFASPADTAAACSTRSSVLVTGDKIAETIHATMAGRSVRRLTG
jgi:hypothetical protein